MNSTRKIKRWKNDDYIDVYVSPLNKTIQFNHQKGQKELLELEFRGDIYPVIQLNSYGS
eukprot:gene10149-2569_t